MKRIIVTGSNGQLGRTLQEMAPNYENLQFDFRTSEELDVSNKEQVLDRLKAKNYDYCINCAAYTDVEQAEKTPQKAYKINAEGVRNLALGCKEYGMDMIHISTDYVFDGEKEGPYTVDDRTNPINEYGKSKLLGEEYIKMLLPNHYIIRTSWLYSKKYGHNFYRTVLRKAMEGEELRITDAQIGCPTNTENLARFILEEVLLHSLHFGIYHFSDKKPLTWYDFAKQILNENGLTGKASLVLDRNYRTFAKRPKNSVLS